MPPNVTTGAVRSYRTLSPLPASLRLRRRFTLCCTFRRLTPPRRYLAPRPMEPGLSSMLAHRDDLADSQRELYTTVRAKCLSSFTNAQRLDEWF
jgi:hypothetical protein